MSYRANQCQQLSIFDRSLHLTERERKYLENSWAKVFSDEVFPAIDEERFRVLYSENASRPNTPVNVIVGALIIKELSRVRNYYVACGYTDLRRGIEGLAAIVTQQFGQELSEESLFRSSVEEALNELLEQEAEKLTQAICYEQNGTR